MSGQPSIHSTYGALLDGCMVSVFMYGVFCAQAVWYYKTYIDDRRPFKIFVGAIWALESIHCALVSHVMWHYFIVRGSIDPTFLLRANWSLIAQVIPTEICVIIGEVFYILRIWRLTDKNKYALLLFVPVIVGTAFWLGYVVTMIRFPLFPQTPKYERGLVSVYAGARVVTDVAVAGTMCGLLYARQSTTASYSRSLIKVLSVWTLTTGLLTSVLTLVYFMTYITMRGNFIFIATYLIHSKIYANATLASLNARKVLRSMSRHDSVYLRDLSSDDQAHPLRG